VDDPPGSPPYSKVYGCVRYRIKSSEIRTGGFVESFARFQQSRDVIEDFTSRTLAVIPTDFGRLYYVSSLKDSTTGRYQHDGLVDVYSENSVQEALEHCHEELFSRILETPLNQQERDLRKCLDSAGDMFWTVVETWRKDQSFRTMCPKGLPNYLEELFCSNLGALLAIFSAERVTLSQAS
jgi:hypothetical protein